jgi:hypothetical protein
MLCPELNPFDQVGDVMAAANPCAGRRYERESDRVQAARWIDEGVLSHWPRLKQRQKAWHREDLAGGLNWLLDMQRL